MLEEIFWLGEKRSHNTLSMDFTTLYSISKTSVPSVLVEFGLQTDGELRPKGCEEILKRYQR
jgi:hypothetical protein